MDSTAAKIILGNVFRTILTAIITFLVTKHVIQADVASHLMRGDTLALWSGLIPINMTMVINILVGLAIPIVLPISLGIWSRFVGAYKTIVARSQQFAVSKQFVDNQASNASVVDIIKTVATGQTQ